MPEPELMRLVIWLPAMTQLMAACGFSAVAAAYDMKTGLIPNRLVGSGAALGVLSASLTAWLQRGDAGLYLGLIYSLGGALCCAPIAFLLFCTRALGGGDGKLFMALGTFLGPFVGLQAELHALCLGSLYLFGVLIYRGELRSTLATTWRSLAPRRLSNRLAVTSPPLATSFKFGPVICAGMLFTLALHWRLP